MNVTSNVAGTRVFLHVRVLWRTNALTQGRILTPAYTHSHTHTHTHTHTYIYI